MTATIASDRSHGADARLLEVLATVPDPEIPALSVLDLGIVRAARVAADGRAEVHLTPTYTGCPATEVIRRTVAQALEAAGYRNPDIREVLSPPWTSDWITEDGRRKLAAFGIAPPARAVDHPRRLLADGPVACPRCGGSDTERISEFGSTPCKAHYRCCECLEPFDYFKCL